MAVTTTSTLAPLTQYIQRTGLSVAIPNLCYGVYGTKNTIPQRNSKTMAFRRYERFAPTSGAVAASTKALTEGTTPSDITPTITNVTLTLAQYGNLVRFSDQAEWINEVSVDENLMSRNSENMAQTMDRVYCDGIVGGTSVARLSDSVGGINGAARVNVAGKLNASALTKVITALKRQDAKFYKGGVGASNKINTQGIRDAFVAIIHPDAEQDLEDVPGYIPVSQYASTADLLPGEVGSFRNLRFVTSTMARIFPDAGATKNATRSTTGTSSDVYIMHVIAKDAYTCVDLASSAEIYYIPQSKVDKTDPLGQFATLGWKAMGGSVILNDAWIWRVEHVCSE